MLVEPESKTELVACYVMVDTDFQEILSGDTIRFLRMVSLDRPDIKLLLKRMNREIFSDFREYFDFNVVEDPSTIIFGGI